MHCLLRVLLACARASSALTEQQLEAGMHTLLPQVYAMGEQVQSGLKAVKQLSHVHNVQTNSRRTRQ